MSAPHCPLHGPLVLDDVDSAYGQETWVCREWNAGCREREMRGPSDWSILADEQGVAQW